VPDHLHGVEGISRRRGLRASIGIVSAQLRQPGPAQCVERSFAARAAQRRDALRVSHQAGSSPFTPGGRCRQGQRAAAVPHAEGVELPGASKQQRGLPPCADPVTGRGKRLDEPAVVDRCHEAAAPLLHPVHRRRELAQSIFIAAGRPATVAFTGAADRQRQQGLGGVRPAGALGTDGCQLGPATLPDQDDQRPAPNRVRDRVRRVADQGHGLVEWCLRIDEVATVAQQAALAGQRERGADGDTAARA